MSTAKVVVADLYKRYGAVEAVNGVSFQIDDGEIFGLLGPNGAGKTTTVECLTGLREPDRGEIQVCGIDARRQPREVKERIGVALQTSALQEKITPREALTLFAAFYRHALPAEQLIDRFSLGEKADAAYDTLSGGQRQRLALALAFVNRPELVFLDEPTAGLDPQARHDVHAEILRMRTDGHTVLLTTHYLEEAQALCDRVAIVDRGRVIAIGPPQELIARSGDRQTVTMVVDRAVDSAAIRSIAGVDSLTASGVTIQFRTATVARTVAEVLARLDALGADVAELHVQKTTLEELFIKLTARES